MSHLLKSLNAQHTRNNSRCGTAGHLSNGQFSAVCTYASVFSFIISREWVHNSKFRKVYLLW